MRLEFLGENHFDDVEKFDDVMRIMLAIADGWHDWYWPDPVEFEDALYFQSLSTHFELALKSYAAAAAYSDEIPSKILFVLDDDESPAPTAYRLRIRQAAPMLSSPLLILVENQINDGGFISTMIGVVDYELAQRMSNVRPPFEWRNGGGKGELTRLISLHADYNSARGFAGRLLAIVDSDAKFPGHVDAKTKELEGLCAKRGVRLHVLRKRSIENYVCDRVLEEYGERIPALKSKIAFIRSLTIDQRDHFPIKSGLSAPLSEQEVGLYHEVDLAAAQESGLPRLIEHLLSTKVVPVEADLLDRACRDEIVSLARTIREEL